MLPPFFRKTLLLFFSCILFTVQGFAYQYELSILAIFRNEADYLQEWIDYHRKLGVEHFILFNHLSEDDFAEVLQPYIDSGLVELYHWHEEEFPAAQLNAYVCGIRAMKRKTKWLAVIDIDEFIVPIQKDDIRKFLADYEAYAGVVINWQLFGTSNIYSIPKGEWITKKLNYKFPTYFDDPTWSSNHFVKSIIRPDRINENYEDDVYGNHVFLPLEGYSMVDADKNVLKKPRAYHERILVDKIRINHYWFRTLKWFYEMKIDRRTTFFFEKYPQEKIDYLLKMGFSEIDLSIQRFLN